MLIFVYKLKWKSKECQWNVFIFFIIYIYLLYLFQLDKTMHKTFFFFSRSIPCNVEKLVSLHRMRLIWVCCINEHYMFMYIRNLTPKKCLTWFLIFDSRWKTEKNEKENEKKQSKSDHNKMYFSVSFRAIFVLNTICPFIRFKHSSSITKSNLMGHRKWLSYIAGLLSAANNLPSTFAFRNTF